MRNSIRFAWTGLTIACLTLGLAAAQDPPKKKEPKRLAIEAYIEKLKAIEVVEVDQPDHLFKVQVIPCIYELEMAKAFHEGKVSGLNELEIEQKLRKLHSKIRRERGKPTFRATLELSGSRNHFFLEGRWKSAVELKIGTKRNSCKVDEVKPRLVFGNWQIFELETHNRYKKKLAYLKDSSFEIKPSGKRRTGDKSPIEISLVRLRRYIEVPKRNEYERIGINKAVRQIALSAWNETALPPVSVTVHPGKWKLPRGPEHLEVIIKGLEE